MLFKQIFLAVCGLLIISSAVYSQPQTTMQFVGGYSIPLGEMKGKFDDNRAIFTNNADSNTYFLQNGFNFGLNFSHSPFKKLMSFKILGGINYNRFSQNKDYSSDTSPVIINYNLRIFTLSIGVEYAYLTKRSKINPFASAEFSANFYSGSLTSTFNSGTPVVSSFNPTSRYGLQLGAGIDFVLGQRVGIITGVKYNMANLIGRTSLGDTQVTYNLNDADATIKGVKYHNRNTYYLQIYAGFSIYLGI